MSRIVVVVGVLLVMLLVPLYLSKERADRAKARALDGAQRAVDAGARKVSAAPVPAHNDPERFGVTFGWLATSEVDELRAGCRGAPHELARAHQGACNLYEGDTACRTVLPLLCLRPAEGDTPLGLATSVPVAGFLIESLADADARCAQALGAGWRIARHEDQGAELRASRPPGTAVDTNTRVWVAVKDQPAHCWDR